MLQLRVHQRNRCSSPRTRGLLITFLSLLALLGNGQVLAADATQVYLTTMYSRGWTNCVDNLVRGMPLPEDRQLEGAVNAYKEHYKKTYAEVASVLDTVSVEAIMAKEIASQDVALYKCSGLLVRSTPPVEHAWEPYPEGRTSDSSFSYLRSDIRMTRWAGPYPNGFILDPVSTLKVDCFFPVDGDSDKRGDKGCGAYEGGSNLNLQCPDNIVMTADFANPMRCRYDLRGADSAIQFNLGVTSAVKSSRVSDVLNELKVETWKKGYDPRMKIRAFFYVNAEGKPTAQHDRDVYQKVSGIRVPVVEMTFPGTKGGSVTFKVVD